MRFSDIALSILTTLFLAFGQIGFKLAAEHIETQEDLWVRYLFNPWLWSSLCVYAIATILWIWVLRHAPLHLAYPWIALAYIFVPLISHYALDTPWRIHQLGGAILISLGIWLTVYES